MKYTYITITVIKYKTSTNNSDFLGKWLFIKYLRVNEHCDKHIYIILKCSENPNNGIVIFCHNVNLKYLLSNFFKLGVKTIDTVEYFYSTQNIN